MKVTGSAAYWRARRNEVHAWISYHLEQNHGPPSFFITLSCAEYHWHEIERLIIDRCHKGNLTIPDFKERRAAIINEHSIVVQEYFHARVDAWLATIGKDVLGIQHHWLRFEFAPSRGQIHIHMLAICDNIDLQQKCYEYQNDKHELAAYLSSWMEDTLGMTAMCNTDLMREIMESSNVVHPSATKFGAVASSDVEREITSCQLHFQRHKCSAYCMRKRKHTRADETSEL